jgi:MYXO-CTERM domain-containing protein
MNGFDRPPVSSPSFSRSQAVIAPSLATLSLLLAASSAEAGVVPPNPVQGQIVLREGDTPTGGPAVVDVRPPWVNAAGEVAFVGGFDNGDHYVFVGNSVVWSGNDDVMATLGAIEDEMGSDGAGNWIYAPDIDGADGLYTNAGVFATIGDPAVGFAGGSYTFLSTPTMIADGTVYWRAGVDMNGDFVSDFRVFYRSTDGTLASAEALLTGGDMIGMFTLDDNIDGINASYAVSDDGMHRIHVLNMEGDPATDGFIWVDDMLVARELDPTGDGDDWLTFGLVSINDTGNYVFTGNTNGAPGTDAFIAYNGTIAVREGDMVGGITLPAGSSGLRFVAISNLEQATHAWAYNGPAGFRETVFFACNAADLAGTSQVVFTTIDDGLDVDGDDVADYTIVDLTIGAPTVSRAIGATQYVYAEVALDDGMTVTEAMIEVPVDCCGNGAVDPMEECDDGNAEDTDDCLSTCVAASCGDGFIQDGVEECDDGNAEDTDDCPTTCVAASCGDGFVQDGVEECDDGNAEDTDDCPTTCVAASCGDGFVQDGVEECDDGNTDAGDGCEADCTLPGSVDDTAGDTTGVDPDGTSGSGGGSGPGPSTVTATGGPANDTGGSADSGTETDTDTDSGGLGTTDDGCSCRTANERGRGLLGPLLGLGLLGLRRRRR